MKIVVEGIGDVVWKYYLGPLKVAVQEGRAEVTFLWDSRYSRATPSYHERLLGHRSELERVAGFNCVDKARRLVDSEELLPDVVFICTPPETHTKLIRYWVSRRKLRQKPRVIVVEKPLSGTARACFRLKRDLTRASIRVSVADNFWPLTRPTPRTAPLLRSALGMRSGVRWLKAITIYHLEDHSGNDEAFLRRAGIADPSRHGPIELEGRTEVLKGGLIRDLSPHPLSHLARWTNLRSFRIGEVRAARYRGVDGDPRKVASIPWETVAEITFSVRQLDCPTAGGPVPGRIALGKGIGGVRSLLPWDAGRSIEGDVKMVCLEGSNGNLAVFDLRGGIQADGRPVLWVREGDAVRSAPLPEHPTVLEWPLNRSFRPSAGGIALDVPISCEIVRIGEAAHNHVVRRHRMPTYYLGALGARTPMLEDALGLAS